MVRISHLMVTAAAVASLNVFTSTIVHASGSNPVTVYKHVNFRGRSLSVSEGDVSIRDIRNSRVGNDAISSIRIEPVSYTHLTLPTIYSV